MAAVSALTMRNVHECSKQGLFLGGGGIKMSPNHNLDSCCCGGNSFLVSRGKFLCLGSSLRNTATGTVISLLSFRATRFTATKKTTVSYESQRKNTHEYLPSHESISC